MDLFSNHKKISIIKYPTGKYGYVGTVPFELTRPIKTSIAGESRTSMIFETEKEATETLEKYLKLNYTGA